MGKSIISKNFKKLRHFKSMNQQEFADLLIVKRSSIGSYEEGRAEPKLEVLIRLADLFKLKVDDIIRKELKVNDIANFKYPENDNKNYIDLKKELMAINVKLSEIESKLKQNE